MSKLKSHLEKHLRGSVQDDKSALEHFSTDGSILKVQPHTIVYPAEMADVRKVSKFSAQLAERGKKLPITSRGMGTDQSGGALGSGIVLSMPAYMNRLVDMDRDTVTVQPGMLYGDLQRTLYSHGRFLPPYPASIEYSTLGGAVANNASGEKSLKYGTTADYVQELEVVLASGEVIRTYPLSKKELNKKKGKQGAEGDIYRAIDGLLIDNADAIEKARLEIGRNAAGYALWDVYRPDGKFDLSRLIVGSQGTLGTVTEITFTTVPYNPDTHLLVLFFDDLEKAGEAAELLRDLEPSALEFIDSRLLQLLQRHQPSRLEGVVEEELPEVMFLVEFDDDKDSVRKRKARKAQKLVRELVTEVWVTANEDEQEHLWGVRQSAVALTWQKQGKKCALPIIEDGIVPAGKLAEFLKNTHRILKHYGQEVAVWGSAAEGNIHAQPLLDLKDAADRQTIFKLMDDFYKMVQELGGSTSGAHNDGRLRAPYLRDLYGSDVYELFCSVKQIFDPHGILNPGVKLNVDKDMVRRQLRHEYGVETLHDHPPGAFS